MGTIEVGRVCVKIAGREAGRYCVVLKKIDENFVLITGPKPLTGVKRRRCNIAHLEPTPYKLDIKEEASDKTVVAAYEKANLIKKFGLKKPSAAELKEKKEVKKKPKKKKTQKAKKKKERKKKK
ncbi:MAG TPA: 50S ribosomal protein L14e [Candidatus Aenigmarchaeota archaeon]|nr:50S ribosomal protein L14e [Candidatus Aenigmarchaeota archaeon]